jgi:hypothetical protein
MYTVVQYSLFNCNKNDCKVADMKKAARQQRHNEGERTGRGQREKVCV